MCKGSAYALRKLQYMSMGIEYPVVILALTVVFFVYYIYLLFQLPDDAVLLRDEL